MDLIIVHSGVCNKESVCARLNCNELAECSKTEGSLKCSCASCPPVYTPVCGNDNQTYSSECELYRTACLLGDKFSSLSLKYHGECISNPCQQQECLNKKPFSHCGKVKGDAISQEKIVCKCQNCGYSFQPVCGGDGILYDNLCRLRKSACEKGATIDIRPLHTCGK